MRHTRAADILHQIDGHDFSYRPSAFAWRGAWLVRRGLLPGALLPLFSPLRKIPGLRLSRLPGLMLSAAGEAPVMLHTSADAIQVGESGERLRAFYVKKGLTVKIVRAEGRYGPATRSEIALRRGVEERTSLPVPRIEGFEEKNGFIFVREQMIAGRAFHARRDRALFLPGVVEPLAAFYESHGISYLPLNEAMGPLAAFLDAEEKAGVQHPPRLASLRAKNPVVASALCHNDTVASNLAVSRGTVYVLDWGLAAQGLCGLDFLRIGRKYLESADICLHLQKHITRLHRGQLDLDDLLAVNEAWMRFLKLPSAQRAAFAETFAQRKMTGT